MSQGDQRKRRFEPLDAEIMGGPDKPGHDDQKNKSNDLIGYSA